VILRLQSCIGVYLIQSNFPIIPCFQDAAARRLEGKVGLREAVRNGFLQLVQDHLTVKPEAVNVYFDSETLLMIACANERGERPRAVNLQIVQLLISFRADINRRNNVRDGYPHRRGWSALHYAVGANEKYTRYGGDDDVIRLLIQNRADVNLKDRE
jgi:hypothetical protein